MPRETRSRSHRSPRYGALAEAQAREYYSLTKARDAWHDAVSDSGDPWEIKAAMSERSDGSMGRFRIFRRPHRALVRNGGYYALVAYRPVGRGIQVDAMRSLDARELEAIRPDWYASRHQTEGRDQQVKIRIDRIF